MKKIFSVICYCSIYEADNDIASFDNEADAKKVVDILNDAEKERMISEGWDPILDEGYESEYYYYFVIDYVYTSIKDYIDNCADTSDDSKRRAIKVLRKE